MANLNEIIVSSHLEMQSVVDNLQNKTSSIHILKYSQHDALNPNRSALKHLIDMNPKWTSQQALKALADIGFPLSLANTKSAYLSGGQAQLLALTLALYTQCTGLVLIDPFAAISQRRIKHLKQVFEQYSRLKPLWLISYTKPIVQYTSDPLKSSPLLRIQKLSVARPKTILTNITLTISKHEVVGIIGDNGTGKSTLAQAIMQILPYSGSIDLKGEKLNLAMIKNKQIQMLFQNNWFNPLVPMSNILLEDFDQTIFTSCLKALSTDHSWINQYPKQVNPITLKSIALARLFARKPLMIILDEPFSGMPNSWVMACIQLLRQYSLTTLIIDHNHDVLNMICHNVYQLKQGVLQ